MADRIEPRWLDRSAAAAYVCMSESAFCRRVALGKFPKPTLAAGEQSPRWDRLALDAAFDAGVDSTDARTAFQGLADEIAAKGTKGATSRAPHPGGRKPERIPLRRLQGQAARSSD